VLIGGFVRSVKINPIMGMMFWLMMHNPWRVRAWAMYYGTIYPSNKPPDFQKYLKDLISNLRQPGRFDAVKAVGNSSAEPSEVRLGRIKSPTLVIMGTKDPDFGDASAEGRYIAQATGGELRLIDGVGHYPQSEVPDMTIPTILDFMRTAEIQSKSRIEPTLARQVSRA
jgi:pimeloyl-ACP methyl ester carboxylesterase